MFEIEDRAPPLSKAERKIEDMRRKAVKRHKEAYAAVHVRVPSYVWAGDYVRIDGAAGVTLARLKKLTRQLQFIRQNGG